MDTTTSSEINKLYQQWCKETKRNGAILVGGSIREFFDWLEYTQYVELTKLAVNSKYRLDLKSTDTGIFIVDIPKFVTELQKNYIIIKK